MVKSLVVGSSLTMVILLQSAMDIKRLDPIFLGLIEDLWLALFVIDKERGSSTTIGTERVQADKRKGFNQVLRKAGCGQAGSS